MDKGRVVSFPKAKKDYPPQTIEDIQNKVQQVRMENISRQTEEVASEILTSLNNNGINVIDESYLKMNALLIELVKAYICKSMDINHPIQQLAEEHFKCIDDGETLQYVYDFTGNFEE